MADLRILIMMFLLNSFFLESSNRLSPLGIDPDRLDVANIMINLHKFCVFKPADVDHTKLAPTGAAALGVISAGQPAKLSTIKIPK